jgi:3',5'-cyclic AMP phosphodiesterase CpdA
LNSAPARVVQLTDTHLVGPGEYYFKVDTAAYLAEAIAFVNQLRPAPEYVVVTGDLVNGGTPDQYVNFMHVMRSLDVPYFAIPGNHDDRAAFLAGLPPAVYGHAAGARVRYAIDEFAVRLIGLDANGGRSRFGAGLDDEQLDWLETTLAAASKRPTIIAVHQPPFRTGLHYFDVFGYPGARRLRRIAASAPQVGRVISGHIHCVKTYRCDAALVASAPSTAPQFVPEFFEHRILGVRHEVPGFTVHDWTPSGGFCSRVYRRVAPGEFTPGNPLELATRR